MLPDDTIDDLRTRARHAIRGGYEKPRAIIEGLVELIEYDPETQELVATDRTRAVAEVSEIVNDEDSRYLAEVATWPLETDCDRIAAVFADLESRGIVARENVGYTQSDLRDEMSETVVALVKAGRTVRGWAGFHSQDLERAVDGGGLYLGYAPLDTSNAAAWIDVGTDIADSFKRIGFKVTWNGTADQRPYLESVDWKRRRR
jgi:uncharacterized protein DUF6891